MRFQRFLFLGLFFSFGTLFNSFAVSAQRPIVRQLATGFYHTCALLSDGSVKCWGMNASGQLGLGDSDSRGDGFDEIGDQLLSVDLGTDDPVRDLQLGYGHTCALFENGKVKCWGMNATGQLGLGDKTSRGIGLGEMGVRLPFVEMGTEEKVRELGLGFDYTCALFRDWTGEVLGGEFGRTARDGRFDQSGGSSGVLCREIGFY